MDSGMALVIIVLVGIAIILRLVRGTWGRSSTADGGSYGGGDDRGDGDGGDGGGD
jgi:hypothetical protein